MIKNLLLISGFSLLTLAGLDATAQTARQKNSGTATAASSDMQVAKPATARASATPAQAAPGTYQFIVNTRKMEFGWTTETMTEIERNRHDKETKFLKLNDFVTVKILPRNVINAPGFRPIEETVFTSED